MPELATALLDNEKLCIFDIIDVNGQYIEEIRSFFRQASQAGQLKCPECGSNLELCAGPIVQPYFRHKVIKECTITQEMKTTKGRRCYYSRKILYNFVKEQKAEEFSIEERKDKWPFTPVVFTYAGSRFAYIYLDGRGHNYEEIQNAHKRYLKSEIKDVWFLNKRHQSISKNLTSDEAELSLINNGIIYYIDIDNQSVDMKKSYENPYGERKYFTRQFYFKDLQLDENGMFFKDFLDSLEEHIKSNKQNIKKLVRISLEDGIDEDYFEFSYVIMDSIMEIWVLPPYLDSVYKEYGYEKEDTNRKRYLEESNDYFRLLPEKSKFIAIAKTINEINRRRHTWEWS